VNVLNHHHLANAPKGSFFTLDLPAVFRPFYDPVRRSASIASAEFLKRLTFRGCAAIASSLKLSESLE
jgi:hypothetical protein